MTEQIVCLREATIAARSTRPNVCTRAKAGHIQIGTITYRGGKGDFEPISGWISVDDAIAQLREMSAVHAHA